MICRVCHGPGGDMHFGGISCRACAAFFRRFFHSKKMVIECTCPIRLQNSHPCRYCRIQKCLEIGMTAEKVQQTRDKHNWKCSNGKFISQPVDPSCSLISSRSTFHITWTIDIWSSFEEKRAKRYGGNFTELNIFQATSCVQYEMDVIWQLVEQIFPLTRDLKTIDKNALLSNFVPKWWQLEPVMDCAKDTDNLGNDNDQCEQVLMGFYSGAFETGREMSRKQILEIFESYYWYFYEKLILPIIQKNFEPTEFMAILWLAFFDSAYTNISEECSKVCQNVRNVILRELRGYQIDKNYSDTRIVEAMETLPIVERAVEKFDEELLICEMNGVVIHKDFINVMRQQRI